METNGSNHATCFDKYRFSESGKYARIILKTGETIIGKLNDINLDERVINMALLSQEPGKKHPENIIVDATFFIDLIAGMSELNPQHYKRIRNYTQYSEYLDKYVSITSNGKVYSGKLNIITTKTIQLKPFLNEEFKDGTPILYFEYARPLTIQRPIKSIRPETRKNLEQVIKIATKESLEQDKK